METDVVWPQNSRASGLAKTIVESTIKGKNKRGRQKKTWEGNITERTGKDLASISRANEDRTRREGIVVKSSLVNQRPRKVIG